MEVELKLDKDTLQFHDIMDYNPKISENRHDVPLRDLRSRAVDDYIITPANQFFQNS